MAYGIQSPPRQSSSSVYSLFLGAEGKSNRRGANELAWKIMSNLLLKIKRKKAFHYLDSVRMVSNDSVYMHL